MERTITAASYTASGGAGLWGAITFNEWMAGFGVILALATFIVNLTYRHLHYRLEKQKVKVATANMKRRS